MKRVFLAVLILAAVALGVYYVFFPASDERQIRNQFALLAKYVGKNTGGKTSGLILKTQALAYLFHDPCGLEVPNTFLSGTYSREEITSNAVRVRTQFQSISLKFYDLEVKISDGRRAEAVFTARLVGTPKAGGGRIQETRELVAGLEKFGRQWLFTDFKVREVLKK